MEIGMLWYDNSPIALKDRVRQAAGYYSEKYGRKPNLCLVHPDMLQTDEGKANGVVIRKGKGVMPGHFWIGVDEAQLKTSRNRKNGGKAGSRRANPKAKAKSTAKVTAKSKAVKKSKTATAKPLGKAHSEKRTRAYLKKKGKSSGKAESKPKLKSKSTVAKTKRS